MRTQCFYNSSSRGRASRKERAPWTKSWVKSHVSLFQTDLQVTVTWPMIHRRPKNTPVTETYTSAETQICPFFILWTKTLWKRTTPTPRLLRCLIFLNEYVLLLKTLWGLSEPHSLFGHCSLTPWERRPTEQSDWEPLTQRNTPGGHAKEHAALMRPVKTHL